MDRWSRETHEILDAARVDASLRHHSAVEPEHLLLALLRSKSQAVRRALARAGADREAADLALVEALSEASRVMIESSVPPSSRLQAALRRAADEAAAAGAQEVPPTLLLVAIALEGGGAAATILSAHVGSVERIRTAVADAMRQPEVEDAPGRVPAGSDARDAGASVPVPDPCAEAPVEATRHRPLFDLVTLEMTALARAGDIEPVVHREVEIARALDILLRRRRNCPVLLGPPGGGKTAVAEGIAQALVALDQGHPLARTRLYALDLARFVPVDGKEPTLSGLITTMFRLAATRADLVFYLNDLSPFADPRSLYGLHALESGLALTDVRVILRATPQDPVAGRLLRTLSRRLVPLPIAPASPEQAIGMVRALAGFYERHHGVIFSDEALGAAIWLGERLPGGRELPGAAFDLLDETAAHVRGRVGPRSPRSASAGAGSPPELAPAVTPRAIGATAVIEAAAMLRTGDPSGSPPRAASPHALSVAPGTGDACAELQKLADRLDEIAGDLAEVRAQIAGLPARLFPPPMPPGAPGKP